MLRRLLAMLCTATIATSAHAQAPLSSLDRLDRLPRAGTSEAAITPIFSQLFLFALPDEFHTVAGGITRKGHFEQHSVLTKETAARWTQRISVSGDEALAFSGSVYPKKLVDDQVARTKKACGDAAASLPLPGVFVGSYDTVAAVVSCGTQAGQSESTMLIVIKGGMDMYTLEWTVRGPPSRAAPKLDATEWTDRLRRLGPVRLCAFVANERPPYPSCLAKR